MQKNQISNSLNETSIKDESCFTPPAPKVNKSTVESSFNTYMSYKSYNLSKSPLKTNTKLTSEDFSQTNSYRNLSFPNYYYNHMNYFYHTRKSSDLNKNENLANIYSDNNKIILNKKFIEREQPQSKEDIKEFVNNLLEYINYITSLKYDKYKMRNLVALKAKIEVRNEDFNNLGLKKEYFIDCLMKMQSELIAFICKYNEQLICDKNGNKKSIIIDEKQDFFSLF